jgi:hypothetical protein
VCRLYSLNDFKLYLIMAEVLEIPKRPKRNFLSEDFKVTSWEVLKTALR